MIILNVLYKCKSGMRDAFLKQLLEEGLDSACRAEAGNLKYDYYIPYNLCDELLLVEKWQDEDALIRHGKQPHFVRIGEVKNQYVNETVIDKFEQ